MYRISVVTICFNNLDELKATCDSVDMQALKPFEHWIIDGSTKPDIKNWLEGTPQPTYRKWQCERDKGISDAFNKGVQRATGDVVYLLNSGDKMFDASVLQRVSAEFEKDKSVMWCHGKLQLMRGGLWVAIGKPFEKSKLYRGMRGTLHPTMYVKRELYDKYGLFDVNLKMAMDYDFLCRIAGEKFAFIDAPLAIFDPTGISSSQYLKAKVEAESVYRKYYGSSIQHTVWGWRQALMHRLLNSAAGKFLYKIKVKLGKENA